MKTIYAKCGFVCSRCAAYKDNVKTKQQRQRGSDGWKKYYGFKIRIDRMYCDGCPTPDDRKPILLPRSCIIRTCAMTNGAETCAHCSEYRACMYDLRIFNPGVDRKEIETRMRALIPEEDYVTFIEPYEHLKHLKKIRASLNPGNIVTAKTEAAKTKVVDFPDKLPFSKKRISAYKALHGVLAAIISVSGKTYAQQVVLKKRKRNLLRLLWTFGLCGKLKKAKGSHLVIDSETYAAQKLPGNLGTVLFYSKILKGFSVYSEVVPLVKEKFGEKGYLTPMGWLKRKGWSMTMSFSKKAGGASGLNALKYYATVLSKRYGKKALHYFEKADLEVLAKKRK